MGQQELNLTKANFFEEGKVVAEASAPGRMDIMGGISDYSGGLVLQMPIKERTTVSLAPREDGKIRIFSEQAAQVGLNALFEDFAYDLFEAGFSYSTVRERVLQNPSGEWAIYVIGCIAVFIKEKGLHFRGADIWITSDVPFGKGVSSSAAIEVAAMRSLSKMFDLSFSDTELPLLAQLAENHVVGAPCGVMDQLASYFGEKDQLLPILCQPAILYPAVRLPSNLHFIGIDSGVKHAVTGDNYGRARTAAFMGYSIIALHEGVNAFDVAKAKIDSNWSYLPFKGYLANITPSIFETHYRDILPDKLTGGEFKEMYGDVIDPVSKIRDNEIYFVSNCTQHPIYENFRVNMFYKILALLNESRNEQIADYHLQGLGELMYQSHASYSRCGLGSSRTDEIVEMVRGGAPQSGIYGARVTGGGNGGTVVILCNGSRGKKSAMELFENYRAKYNTEIKYFDGTSSGARYTEVFTDFVRKSVG